MSDAPEKPAAAPETPERKRRFRFGCLGICVCAFLMLVLTWVGVKLWMVHALNSEIAALRAAGEPVTWEEVIAGIEPIPDEENLALVLLPHLASLPAWKESPAGSAVVGRSEGWLGARRREKMVKLMRSCVADNRVALDALYDAAKCPSGRWPVNPDPSMSSDHYMPILLHIRSAVRLLDVEAELRATEGDGHGAALSVRAMRRLAASLDESPYLIATQVRFACGAMSVDAAEHALGLTRLPAADLAMLRDEFATEAQQLSLRTAVRGERAGLLWLTTELAEESGVGLSRMLYIAHVMIPGTGETDAIFGLKHTTGWAELLDLPPRELRAAAKLYNDRYELTAYDWKAFVFHPISTTCAPVMARSSDTFVAAKLRLHVACTALAVEEFRLKNSRWPDKLADLVPDYIDAVPQDWFAPAGTTVSYARTPAGVRIWSRVKGSSLGLAKDERRQLASLAQDISSFFDNEGRLPKTLDELLTEDYREVITIDPRTGKPYTYVTNPANPDLFIIGGFTDGKSETEFWKQTMMTEDWNAQHWVPVHPIVFRLLNPKLRGATQIGYCDDDDHIIGIEDEHPDLEEEEDAAEDSGPSDVPPDTPAEPAP